MVNRGVAVALTGAVALVACGGGQEPARSEPPRSEAARPDPPRDDSLALRWRMTGGIAGLGGPGTLPEFSLYADGRAIVPLRSNAPVPALREYRLRPEALRKLLLEARAAGLDRSRTHGSEAQIADAMVLFITMGEARTRVVQPEAQHVPAVSFWKRLDPKGWPQADQAAPPAAYRAPRIAALAGESPATDGRRVSDWPVDRPLGEGVRAAGGLCTVYTGEDRDTVFKHIATAMDDRRWRSGGRLYSVRLRPMLPDERTCEDITRS
ncbi:hypothetical protein [Spirillospora sp. NPDC029432]|uniref:hypothetical protein n=1 Tax=Spirillospora sp. NPDC029432 TaxID=3154599 RepID=UPI0034551026